VIWKLAKEVGNFVTSIRETVESTTPAWANSLDRSMKTSSSSSLAGGKGGDYAYYESR